MFDDDDEFGFNEEDILKAAEKIESQISNFPVSNPPTKRRSFELGSAVSPLAKKSRFSSSPPSSYSPVLSIVDTGSAIASNKENRDDNEKVETQSDPKDPLGLNRIFGFESAVSSKKDVSVPPVTKDNAGTKPTSCVPSSSVPKKTFQFQPQAKKTVIVNQRSFEGIECQNQVIREKEPLLKQNNSKNDSKKEVSDSGSVHHSKEDHAFGKKPVIDNKPKTSSAAPSRNPSIGIFGQNANDSDLDLSFDDLSPWNPDGASVKKDIGVSGASSENVGSKTMHQKDKSASAVPLFLQKLQGKFDTSSTTSHQSSDNLRTPVTQKQNQFKTPQIPKSLAGMQNKVISDNEEIVLDHDVLSHPVVNQVPEKGFPDLAHRSSKQSSSIAQEESTVQRNMLHTPSTHASSSSVIDGDTPLPRQRCNIPSEESIITPATGGPLLKTQTKVSKPMLDTSVASSVATTSGGGKRKRKFPGPAGVLPKLKQGLESVRSLKPATPVIPASDDIIPSSQNCEDRFLDETWLAMKREMEPQAAEILHEYSISQVMRKAMKKHLPRGKVPIMCCLVDQINLQSTTADASVTLKDQSGEMKGTIHRQLLKDYPGQMNTGTVLVLRQVAVFSPTNRSHYLNITPNNVVRAYSKDPTGNLDNLTISKFITDDFKLPDPSDFLPPPSPKLPAQANNHSPVIANRPNLFPSRYGSGASSRFQSPPANTRPRFNNNNNARYGGGGGAGQGGTSRFSSPQPGHVPRGNSPRFSNSPRFTNSSPRFSPSTNQTLPGNMQRGSSPSLPSSSFRPSGTQSSNFNSQIGQKSSVSTGTGHQVTSPKPPPPWLKPKDSPQTVGAKDNAETGDKKSDDAGAVGVVGAKKDTIGGGSKAGDLSSTVKNTVASSGHSKFAFKKPTFQPPTKTVVNQDGGQSTRNKDATSAGTGYDVNGLLDGIEDGLLDDF